MSSCWLDDAHKMAIAEAIKDYLGAKGISRKSLARHDLSDHTINKALAGDFSRATLVKLEAILGQSFHEERTEHNTAPQDMGGYAKQAVEHLVGSYVFIRPAFTNTTNVNAYKLEIRWDDAKSCLVFQESSRADAKYIQNGSVYIAQGRSFVTLATIALGSVRSVVLNQFDDGVAKGIISTVYNLKGAMYVPVTAPVALLKMPDVQESDLGIIGPTHGCHESYTAILSSVVTDEFCAVITGPSSAIDRRKSLAVA